MLEREAVDQPEVASTVMGEGSTADRILKALVFLACLGVLLALIAAIVGGSTWFVSEVLLRMMDYDRVDHHP